MDAAQEPGRDHPTIIAVFENLADAEYGLAALGRTGLRREDISVIVRDREAAADLLEGDTGSNLLSGATTGAAVGGVVGGLAGGLLALLVPGVGPILGTGILANMLAGLAVGAAGGGILGALLGLGVPEEDAATYQEHVQAGRVLMTISADTPAQARQVLAALDASNAYDVRLYGGAGGPAAPAASTPATFADEAAPVPALAALATSAEPVDRTLAVPPPPEPVPLVSGDVAAVEEGGPDVRGESGEPSVASRGLGDEDSDLSAWRSGGDAARPEPPAERDLGTAELGGAVPEADAVLSGGGDVAAVSEGGPDVRPPNADRDSRDLGGDDGTGGGAWADDPTDWRSGGEAARAETGEGLGDPGSADRGLGFDQPAPPAPEPSPPADPYFSNPRLLSRSALRYAVPGPDAATQRDLAPESDAPADPNPEGYGDGGT